ncbi:MAG: DUF4189 domain-containing protein [Devosia sp.]
MLLALLAPAPATAFTVLAVSHDNGYGYCNDKLEADEAESCALDACRQQASDPDTCEGQYWSVTETGEFSLALGKGIWGVGVAETIEASEKYAVQNCGDGCAVVDRWTESVGMPEYETQPALDLDDPAHTVVLIATHGSYDEYKPDICHLDYIDVPAGLSSSIADLEGTTIDGLTVEVDGFCTPHKATDETNTKVEWRKLDLQQRVEEYIALGVPPDHLFIVGHSAGGWAALLLKMEHPEFFNAVIAAAPAFAGEAWQRSPQSAAVRAAYLDRMEKAPDLSALVFAFANDTFEPPEALGQLQHANGVEFHALSADELKQAGCPEWTHGSFTTDCFALRWEPVIAEYLAKRLAD